MPLHHGSVTDVVLAPQPFEMGHFEHAGPFACVIFPLALSSLLMVPKLLQLFLAGSEKSVMARGIR